MRDYPLEGNVMVWDHQISDFILIRIVPAGVPQAFLEENGLAVSALERGTGSENVPRGLRI